jgi:hypothetical protein
MSEEVHLMSHNPSPTQGPGGTPGSSGIPPQGQTPPPPPMASGASPFAKMLGPTATPEQIKQFLNTYLKDIISQMQEENQRAIAAIKKLRETEEEKDQ